jgi:cysteinyl-tRNA synthetase
VELPRAFAAALDDDLGTPAAVAAVHDTVRSGNTALADGDKDGAAVAAVQVRAMTDVLGVDPLDPHWRGSAARTTSRDRRLATALDALVRADLDARADARAARDYATADAVRARLASAGIVVEDTPSGARWTLQEGS